MTLPVRAKVLLRMWSYVVFMTRRYPLNNSDLMTNDNMSINVPFVPRNSKKKEQSISCVEQ